MIRPALVVGSILLVLLGSDGAAGHDIPNARVDRSIQVTVGPDRLDVDYEVSLAELTLVRDLRALIGVLPESDLAAWADRYGREVGPLNAKGLVTAVDGRPIELTYIRFELIPDAHPLYRFHFEAGIPRAGRLAISDQNYEASEGTSRLAVRGVGGVDVRGDGLPTDVNEIEVRPVWELSDDEERRTKAVAVAFRVGEAVGAATALPPTRPLQPRRTDQVESASRLGRLLGDRGAWGIGLAGLLAFGLGASHAIQPGHGKTLIGSASLGRRGDAGRAAGLALVATSTHLATVIAAAAGLWMSRSARYAEVDRALAIAAGFAVAAIGLWRLGRLLGGFADHSGGHAGAARARGVIGLGIAAGAIPCWDAIGLVILAEAVGRLPIGLALLVAFGAGMGVVLFAVALLAGRLDALVAAVDPSGRWTRRLGLAGAIALTGVGLATMIGPIPWG